MNRYRLRPLVALLLTLTLLMSLAGPAFARETDVFTNTPQELDFKSLKPGKPDTAAFYAAADGLETAIAKAGNADKVKTLLTQLFTQRQKLDTDYYVFYYHYNCNPATYTADYLLWQTAQLETGNRFTDCVARIAASDYSDVAVQVLGQNVVDYMAGRQMDTPEMMALRSRHSGLVSDYWLLSAKEYTVTHDGITYRSASEVDKAYAAGDLDYDVYLTLAINIARQANAEAGPIFLEISKTLNQYATLAGYDNYGAYAYANVFERDYTMEDSAQLHTLVKEYFVPLQNKLNAIYDFSPVVASSAEPCQALFTDATQDDIITMVQPYMGNVSSEFADLFDYMLRCGLVDLEPGPTKNQQGFCAELPSYHSAYIYNAPYGTPIDASILAHEFGHFAGFSFADTTYAGFSMDVAEVNSQGLEVLYLPYADEMLGEEAAPYYRINTLSNLIGGVVNGCIVDEFLQAVYTTPDMTLDDANRLYHDISESYGNPIADDTYSYGWTAVPHNYESPFYYISYATSALSALDLLDRSLTDYDAACDTYLNLTKQGTEAQYGFLGALEKAGLDNIFEQATIVSITEAVEGYAYDGICGVDFPDSTDHWAESDALFCASVGLFGGDQNGSFLPEGTLTRAQAATLLWRMSDSPAPEATSTFSDVSADAWYAQGANWCAENGIITSTSAAQSLFSPETPISRQEMTVLLYRMSDTPTVETTPLPFPDAAAVADWAVDSMIWAVEYEILSGKSSGMLAPADTLTRGEAATLLSNYYLK